jgi:hypothetical protein
VSPQRRHLTTLLTRVALTAAIVLTVDGAAVGLGPTAVLASTPTESGATAATADAAPASSTVAPPVSSGTVTAQSTVARATVYSEASSHVAYHGTWSSAASSRYIGGHVKYARARSASASFSFTGTKVSWIGPVGPTRGKASVYVDGKYVRTVNSYARSFVAQKVLFGLSWSSQKAHTLKVVVAGTAGHPLVAIDAFKVTSLVTVASPSPAPSPSPSPTPPPSGSGSTVTVSSISSLRSVLADNSVGTIIVKNGTYAVSRAANDSSTSLWIGPRYASRTRPVLVRAETTGGVTFTGSGGSGYGALAFEGGAHDQTWDGFRFTNMAAYQSGIIEIAGYTTRAAPHHITLRNLTITSSCTGRATTANGNVFDHAVYFSQAASPGAHDIVFENFNVDGRGNLATAFHFFHGADQGGYNAHNVTIRNLTVIGTQQAFLIWEPSVYNVTLDGAHITNARAYAIRFETIGSKIPTGIVIKNVTSTGSGYQGFYSTLGAHPPGVTFSNDSLH